MIVFLLVFIVALFLYIHVIYQWKVSNEIDIPHISLPDKDTLEQVANTHQPFLFEKDIDSSVYFNGEERKEVNIQKQGELPIKVPHKAMISAVKKEPYLSTGNLDFLNMDQVKILNICDTFLKPYMNWKSHYDILYGNKGVYTNLETSLNGRNYFAVVEGYVELKLCTPRCGKFLRESNTANSYKEKSKINVWEPSENDKVTLKECDTILIPVQKGSIIHIPSRWWYSFKFPELACVVSFSYSTYMNAISQIPGKVTHLLRKNKIEI